MNSPALSALSAWRRDKDIESIASGTSSEFDIIIIGGGITGAGLALDAATRGLRTLLLEKHDLAFGTSRWSSKLAHGGLRYLSKGEFGIAYNSAVERGILMEHTAPHLVRALPQVMAIGEHTNIVQTLATRVGFLAGDALRILAGTSAKILPRSRFAGKKETIELCPAVKTQGLKGSWVNYDGQMVDDARMVTAVSRTAAEAGATILTYCDVTEATGTSVQFTDVQSGTSVTATAKAVINATGVWAGGLDGDIKVRPSRGTHIVLSAEALGNPQGALTVPLPGSISRYLFILPAPHGRCYLGLTDEEAPGDIPDVPESPEEDIDFLLKNINQAMDRALTREDVLGAFSGLRPLLDLPSSSGSSTADLSRRHAIVQSRTGMYSVVGGKFTEYRLMAEETLDQVIKEQGIRAGKCRTRRFPLIGAPGHPRFTHIARRDLYGLPESLIRRFGNEAPEVIAAATVDNPLDELGGGTIDITRAEVEYAFTHEGALSADDVLERRYRASMIPSDAAALRNEVEEIRLSISQ